MGFSLAPLSCIIFIFPAAFIGGMLIVRSRRGTPSLSEPRCAKCNYDLRGFSGTAPVRCSECGADLTIPHAILWGRFQPSPRKLWSGIGVMLAPFLLLLILFLLFHAVASARPAWIGANGPGSPGFSPRSNAAVIASLATSASTPWDWQELERRMQAGTLPDADVVAAIDQLIAFLKTQPVNQPLVWSDGFLKRADHAGKISPEQYLRLAKAFYKGCTVSVAPTVRAGASLAIIVHGGNPWQLPGDQAVYALRQMTLDGADNPVISNNQYSNSGPPNPDYLSGQRMMDISGHTSLNTTPGTHALTFTCDVAVLREKTAPQIVNNLPGQSSNWPSSTAAWTETISVPINVVSADQSPIKLETNPSLDPKTTGAIHVQNILVIRKGSGRHVSLEMSIDGSAMPVSFDVLLRIAGKEYPAGIYMAWPNSSTVNDMGCDLPVLDPAIQTVDLLLRPNPSNMEKTAPVDRIWGREVDLLNLPIQRYDVQGK